TGQFAYFELFLSFSLLTLGSGARELSLFRGPDETSLPAAKLELLVLRVSLPAASGDRHKGIQIVPESVVTTTDSAAERLARMAKPLVCIASTSESGPMR